MRSITTVKDLESVVGTRRQAIMMKSIAELDAHCVTILSQSPLAVLGYVGANGEGKARVVGGTRGFLDVMSPRRVVVPVPPDVSPPVGSGVSMCFLLPGIGEPLRVNGRSAGTTDGGQAVTVEVEEAFVHCGKCVYRAKLWDEPGVSAGDPSTGAPEVEAPTHATGAFANSEVSDFLVRSPFAVLTTWDASGAGDASPKGDPGGFVRILDERTIAIPDRKGNRRTDTFHNILEHPEVAMVTLVPGDERALEINGTAIVTDDGDVLATMAVQGSVPKAALIVTVNHARLQSSPAIASAGLWDPGNHVPLDAVPNMIRVGADHMARNQAGGLLAGVTRSLSRVARASGPVLEAGQKLAYEHDLY